MKRFTLEGIKDGRIVYPHKDIAPRSKLTMDLDQAMIYDERDNPTIKLKWWNTLFPDCHFHTVKL